MRSAMSAIGTKRTLASARTMSAFGGKADMAFALRMSAFDPKRTSVRPPFNPPTRAVRCCVLLLGGGSETARIHQKGLVVLLVAWPLAARAQERVRRIGVLMTTSLGDPETQARTKAFLQGMQELGWTEGRNIRF